MFGQPARFAAIWFVLHGSTSDPLQLLGPLSSLRLFLSSLTPKLTAGTLTFLFAE